MEIFADEGRRNPQVLSDGLYEMNLEKGKTTPVDNKDQMGNAQQQEQSCVIDEFKKKDIDGKESENKIIRKLEED